MNSLSKISKKPKKRMKTQKAFPKKKKIHRSRNISPTKYKERKRKLSLNHQLRNELKRKQKRNRNKRKPILSQFASPKPKYQFKNKESERFKNTNRTVYSRYSSLKKRTSPSIYSNLTNFSFENHLRKLKKFGYREENIQLKKINSIFGEIESSIKRPKKNQKRSQSRSKSRKSSYRNQLFEDLKGSFNLRQVQSDAKKKKKGLGQKIRDFHRSQVKKKINEIKDQCRQFMKTHKLNFKSSPHSPVKIRKIHSRDNKDKENKANRLKTYRFKNAILVKDPKSRKGIVLYRTGEVFFGNLNHFNKINGFGIFFFPFCGFVYGNFKDSKIHQQGVFKEPDSSFGIGSFDKGIINDFQIHFNLVKKNPKNDFIGKLNSPSSI
jgi:hypothetical protein